MKKQLLMVVILCFSIGNIFAFDMSKIYNTKEIQSVFVNHQKRNLAHKKIGEMFGSTRKFYTTYDQALNETLDKVSDFKQTCGLHFIKEFKYSLKKKKISTSRDNFELWLHAMRQSNYIDDILADLLSDYNKIDSKLRYYAYKPAYPRHVSIRYNVANKSSIIKAYQDLNANWPNGKDACVLDSYRRLAETVRQAFNINSNNITQLQNALMSTNYYAFKEGLISRVNWNRLDIFRNEEVLRDEIDLRKYLDITLNAKDMLKSELLYLRKDTRDQVASNRSRRYLSHLLNRYQQLTRRKKLYQTYTSQQILLLADIVVKASKRMNAYKSEIRIDYRDDEVETPDEIYVISPMEQYRMSLKMLRKDYANTSMSSLFNGIGVDYEDIVMASLETGVIGFDELDFIVQYENFWLPKRESTWQKVRGFLFGFAGTASFFLPTPFNVVGAVGLVYTETLLYRKNQEVDSSNNANSIFK